MAYEQRVPRSAPVFFQHFSHVIGGHKRLRTDEGQSFSDKLQHRNFLSIMVEQSNHGSVSSSQQKIRANSKNRPLSSVTT